MFIKITKKLGTIIMLYKSSTYRTAPLLHCTTKFHGALHKKLGTKNDRSDGALHKWGSTLVAHWMGYRCTLTVYSYTVNIYSTLSGSMGASVLISLDYVCKNCTAQAIEGRECPRIRDRSTKIVQQGPRGPYGVP